MSAWTLIGVGLIILGFAIASRLETRAVMPIVERIRRLRVAAAGDARRETAPADHPFLQTHREYYESTSRDLEARGFVMLGDLVEYREDGTEAGISRWFATADGSIAGWFSVVTARSVPVMTFASGIEPEKFVVTFFGLTSHMLAVAPSVHRTFVEHGRGIDAAIEAHRQGIAASGGAIARAVQSLEEAVASLDALRSHVRAWRASQDAAELARLDVRSMMPELAGDVRRVVERVLRRG